MLDVLGVHGGTPLSPIRWSRPPASSPPSPIALPPPPCLALYLRVCATMYPAHSAADLASFSCSSVCLRLVWMPRMVKLSGFSLETHALWPITTVASLSLTLHPASASCSMSGAYFSLAISCFRGISVSSAYLSSPNTRLSSYRSSNNAIEPSRC